MDTRQHAARLIPEMIAPAVSYADIKRQQSQKALLRAPAAFKVRAQLLEAGRTDAVLAASDHLTLRLKVYASGGENELHAHANEDHIFIVMDGVADFFDEDGPLVQLSRLQGLMLPRGTRYRFIAASEAPLVMLRIGSPNESAQDVDGRIDANGLPTHSPATEAADTGIRPLPNRYFG
jgi:mannose-6-phosphate isomerase-like protein (cupin superfamily)